MNVSAYLIGLLICISLVISDAKHLFMCQSALAHSGFPQRNNHFDPWPFFFSLGVYVFLILSCVSCLYVLEMNSLWVSSFENISSYSEGCPYLSLRVSFWYSKAFRLIRSHFLICGLFFIFLRGRSTKNLLHSCQIVFCLYFSQEFQCIHPHN